MRIDSSTVGMESARRYRSTSTTLRRFTIMDYRQSLAGGNGKLNSAVGGNAGNAGDNGKGNAGNSAGLTGRSATVLQDWQTRLQSSGSSAAVRTSSSQTYANIRQHTVSYIFNMLFSARRNRWSQWLSNDNMQTYKNQSGTQDIQTQTGDGYLGVTVENGKITGTGSFGANLKVLNYNQTIIETETEETSFSTVGTVRTSDGREIQFNVNVGMSREFQQYYEQDLQLASFTMCDPLVINLDTDVAELADQTFYFDIDGDGELDEVSQLGAGSGYLALDKNGDGVINDGSELFGTASGNGFADLAKYDQDGNGWIDENDEIWHKLKIWCKDENGNDVLYRLADKGVGAICLQNAATDFTLKGEEGKTKGAIRNTGVFLYENGNVGTVQHVDVAKYYAQA